MSFYDAARGGDAGAVRSMLAAGADPDAVDGHGFAALHHAAMGAAQTPVGATVSVLRELLAAGASVDLPSSDGRTPLYLAAEFAPSAEAVRLLLEHGAEPDVVDRHGNHIVINARADDVRDLLSQVTGQPVPPPAVPARAPGKLSARQWRAAQRRVAAVLDELAASGLVALPEAGYTQEDGFAACVQLYRPQHTGFCYYTEQDAVRARRSGELPIAFWGAPDGTEETMIRTGTAVAEAFRRAGLVVEWDGTARVRPTVLLA